MDETTTTTAAPRYRLGDNIPLEDFLAFPSGGRRLARSARGRLVPMSPDDQRRHLDPLSTLYRLLLELLGRRFLVYQEPSVHFPRIYNLRGEVLPPSRLGQKAIEPDLAVFEGRPAWIESRPAGITLCAPERLRLVVELLSAGSFRSDLGEGRANRVDKARTYLEGGVPEYWLLNAGVDGLPLPPRSGLFLRRADRDGAAAWEPLPVGGARRSPGRTLRGAEAGRTLRGAEAAPPNPPGRPGARGKAARGAPAARRRLRDLDPVTAGVVRSLALPGLALDLDAFWRELDA